MYTTHNRVGYSELDANGNMTLHAIINRFQDCSTFQSEHIGVGLEYLQARQRAWMLMGWQIKVEQYPQLGEELETGTWPTEFKGLYGMRNFQIRNQQGQLLVWANSIWAFMDTAAKRPVKPLPEEIAPYQLEAPLPYEFAPRKVKVPVQLQEQAAVQIFRYHLDTNRHVNNGQYVQLAAEYLPEGCCPEQVRVSYQKSAVFGDTVIPRVHRADQVCTIVLDSPAGIPYAVVEFILGTAPSA